MGGRGREGVVVWRKASEEDGRLALVDLWRRSRGDGFHSGRNQRRGSEKVYEVHKQPQAPTRRARQKGPGTIAQRTKKNKL